jgi:hypothetical protein
MRNSNLTAYVVLFRILNLFTKLTLFQKLELR